MDITDEKGMLYGKFLADLGTNVIRIERLGGDKRKNIGQFWEKTPNQKGSLF